MSSPWRSIWKVGVRSPSMSGQHQGCYFVYSYLGKRGKELPNWCFSCVERRKNQLIICCCILILREIFRVLCSPFSVLIRFCQICWCILWMGCRGKRFKNAWSVVLLCLMWCAFGGSGTRALLRRLQISPFASFSFLAWRQYLWLFFCFCGLHWGLIFCRSCIASFVEKL